MKAVTIWRAGKRFPAPSRARLRKMTAAAAELAGLHDVPGGVCVSFLSPAGIERVNEEFLGHHGPTDVISFDYRAEDDPGFAEETDAFEVSDAADPSVELIVCPAVAYEQAMKRGLPYAEEVALYVSHGLLHAAGYDDLNPKAKRVMRRAEKRVMAGLRRAGLIPPMEHKDIEE
jgi:probable rRNA maturation factor